MPLGVKHGEHPAGAFDPAVLEGVHCEHLVPGWWATFAYTFCSSSR
jgi:hypothetical protein